MSRGLKVNKVKTLPKSMETVINYGDLKPNDGFITLDDEFIRIKMDKGHIFYNSANLVYVGSGFDAGYRVIPVDVEINWAERK